MRDSIVHGLVVSGIAVCLLGSLSGCGGSSPTETVEADNRAQPTITQEGETGTAVAEKKKILTTFTVIADMAQNIGGDTLVVESITRMGAEIHGYEPTPSDLVKAQNADLVLYNGMNLERWFEQFLGNLQDVPSALVTGGIEPIPIAQGPYADTPNPHAWMSPRNGLIYVENIRKAFIALDPDNAATYTANANAYSQKIQAIDQQLSESLNQVPENQRFLVSCEGAFSYLAKDYGLQEIYLWPINAEQQYTPKQMQNVIQQVRANKIPTIFCESTVSDKGQREVAKTAGAHFGGNLYVDSLTAETGPVPTYLKLLAYDARTIAEGLLPEAKFSPSSPRPSPTL